MLKNNHITKLLTKEMDRKDFLKYSGGVLLAVIGVTGLLNTLSKVGDDHKNGYGTSAYGR
jgi:hypothetical protein